MTDQSYPLSHRSADQQQDDTIRIWAQIGPRIGKSVDAPTQVDYRTFYALKQSPHLRREHSWIVKLRT